MMPPTYQIHTGNALAVLQYLDPGDAQCCVTSPPYWGLRDYGDPGQDWPSVEFTMALGGLDVPVTIPAMTAPLGLEKTPIAFVGHLVAIFREVRRVLSDDGVLWLNIGDTYASTPCGGYGATGQQFTRAAGQAGAHLNLPNTVGQGLKQKDLVGIPWLLAYALRSDGWYLRSDVIWHKRNPMPESVTDRPTKGHEYVFLLAKSDRYFYDADAIGDRASEAGKRAGGYGRRFVGIELMPENVERCRERCESARVKSGLVTADDALPGQQLGLLR